MAETLPLGLPEPLREFYTEGAGECRCRYHWSPGKDDLPQIQEIFPHQMSFYGGPELIPWNELREAHEIHHWWDDLNENVTEEQEKARDAWRHTVPFINVGNGDCVALHIKKNSQTSPVVYLCHDDPEMPVTPLSTSFDQFLSDWETLCYVGPEIWLLDAFLSEQDQRQLNVQQENVRRWRDILGVTRE